MTPSPGPGTYASGVTWLLGHAFATASWSGVTAQATTYGGTMGHQPPPQSSWPGRAHTRRDEDSGETKQSPVFVILGLVPYNRGMILCNAPPAILPGDPKLFRHPGARPGDWEWYSGANGRPAVQLSVPGTSPGMTNEACPADKTGGWRSSRAMTIGGRPVRECSPPRRHPYPYARPIHEFSVSGQTGTHPVRPA